jgi:hypothetical protein
MSTVTKVIDTSNLQGNDYDVSKVFLRNIISQEETLNNASGAAKDFEPGTLLGRVTASGKLIPLASAANDGSQFAVGVLMSNVIQLANGADQTVSVCIGGEVAEDKVVLAGADALTTTVTNNSARTIKDVIAGDTKGIQLRSSTELTGHDNS